jgi:hypothetical protein
VLTTSLVTAAGTWAVVVVGGSAATHNNFWQLFVRPAGSSTWKLVTPPGVADNGGLVVADTGGRSLVTAFRPSQYLRFTPMAVSGSGGRAWSPAGPLGGALANVPDALAASPATGQLFALLTGGTVELASPGYTRWSTVVSRGVLDTSPAGQRCGVRGLVAVAYSPAGGPLLGAACARPGVTGILSATGGTWQVAGPAMPGALARDPVTVRRLTTTGSQVAALLQAGGGRAARWLVAWSADGGQRWVASPPLRLTGAGAPVASFGPSGAIVASAGRADVIGGPGGSWRSLPALPAGTATVAPGPAGAFDALTVHRARLTVWRLGPESATWRVAQVIDVPIQYGSSG